MLEKEAKRQGFDLYKDLFVSEWLEPIFKRYTFHELDDLYAGVGCGGVSTNQILQRLIEECQKKQDVYKRQDLPVSFLKDKDRFQIILCGFMNMQFLYHPAFQKKYTV